MQTVAEKSQDQQTQDLTNTHKGSLQTSLQTETENGPKQSTIDKQELPPDLAEIVAVWPALPEHIKAAVKALVRAAKAQQE
ncbi:MAG: hypothetical protein ACYS8I_12420 [Planctomycetota bacterium]